MVLALQPVLAEPPEVAERAVVARIGAGRGPGGHRGPEALAHPAEVGGHVGEADGDALAGPEDDVREVGREVLGLFERLAVEGELERVLRTGMPRQLRVQHLVAPGAERRGPVDPLQEVRDSPPALREEHGLVDVVRAPPHRLRGAARAGLEVAPGAQTHLDDGAARIVERREERLFVLLALAPEELGIGVLVARPPAFSQGHRQLQLGQVLAGQEAAQVRR